MRRLLTIFTMALLCTFAMQSCEGGAEESDNTPGVGGGTGGDDKPGTGGSTEAGAPKFLEVNPGDGKAEVVWLVNGDEKNVKYSYFYYTNEAGKTNESLQATGKSADTLRKIISMSEGKYTLSVKNFYESSKEYSASSDELTVEVYGETYKSAMVICDAEATYTKEEGGKITWGDVDVTGYMGSAVNYTNSSNEEIEMFITPDEEETIFTDVQGGSQITYRSYYKPAVNALDTLVTASKTLAMPLDMSEQIVVSSLKELMPYLKMDNANVKLKPGTYDVTHGGFATKEYGTSFEVNEGQLKLYLILVEGDNCKFDFTDVNINVDTDIFRNLSGYDGLVELSVIGSDNVVTGLTLRDIIKDGEREFHNGGCTNVIMDGYNNKFEYITIYSTGSYPYGYGEVFGKGGSNNTIGHQKHSSFLIRGTKSHAYRCNVTHYSYGHCMVMQGADLPLLEECVIQSEMTTTDIILAEEGTGSAADKIDFKTTWGYRLQPGYTLACSEEGIRAYNGGETIVKGVRLSRGTSNPTIKNCYVKTARAGVTLTHATGKKYVEGTTVIGCDRGFCIGTGDIVDCYADCSYGPAYGVDYESNSGVTAEITLLPNELPLLSGNGSKHVAIIIGGKQTLHFKNYEGGKVIPTYDAAPADNGTTGNYAFVTEPYTDPRQPELAFQIGGDNRTIGMWDADNNYKADGITITNDTGYRIILDDNSKNCKVTTKGPYEDYGTGNSITGGTDEKGTTPQPADGNVIYGGNNFQ